MHKTLALFLAFATPVAADVTPEEVWTELQRFAATGGAQLSADTLRRGGDLVLDGLQLDLGPADDPVFLRMDRLVLREVDYGSVALILPDRFQVTLEVPGGPSANGTDRVSFSAAVPGLDVRVEDLGARTAFRVRAPSASLTLDPSPLAGGDEVALNLALADLTLDHRQDLAGATSTVETTLGLGTAHFDGLIAIRDGERVALTLDLSAIAGSLFLDVDPARLQDATATLGQILSGMADGQAIRARLEHGAIALGLVVTDDQPGPRDMRLTSASGEAALRVDRTGFDASVRSDDTALSAVIDDPEVPISDFDLGYQDLGFGVSLGFPGPAGPVDYAAFARLSGLVMSDTFWAPLDPGSVFPRDPISVALSVSGQLEEKSSSLSSAVGEDVPVDLLSLSLDEMSLSGLGLALTGEGALTFDNSDLVTFDGAPAPTGDLHFAATGINALLDRAVAAGMVPPEDLTGLRFGLAFIAKPDGAPDSLSTRIEFRDKSLYLNGVKMR